MNESLVGKLLIASTVAPASVFHQSVCLIVHQDTEAIVGLLLNRPIVTPPTGLLKQWLEPSPEDPESSSAGLRLPELAAADDQPASSRGGAAMHFGGPLSGPLLALHGLPQAAEAEASPGIYVAAAQQNLQQLVQQHTTDFRLIIGHCGWSVQQMHDELLAGYWHLLPSTPENTLRLHDDLWPLLIHRATGLSLASWVGARDTSGEVGLN